MDSKHGYEKLVTKLAGAPSNVNRRGYSTHQENVSADDHEFPSSSLHLANGHQMLLTKVTNGSKQCHANRRAVKYAGNGFAKDVVPENWIGCGGVLQAVQLCNDYTQHSECKRST